MRHNPTDNIQFDLIENGLDFVSSGVEHILKDKSPHLLKYAILHLSAGTELLLKEILKNEHWSLIFENPNIAKYELLSTGEFKSVDFETLITRLMNISEIEMSEKDISILRQLRKLRNKIEHFEFNQNTEAIKSLSSKVLCLLLNFINENFKINKLSDTSKEYVEKLRRDAIKFKEFATLRTAQIKTELTTAQKKYKMESCPLCRQAALVLNDDLQCLFCGYTDEAEKVSELYAENILGESRYICMTDGGEFPVIECIHCGEETFVDKGTDGYVCFSCFETNQDSDLNSCSYCGQLFESRDDESEMCEYCVDYFINKDN
ncbi:hypothetical protein [Peijinzhouia sedimentorum]